MDKPDNTADRWQDAKPGEWVHIDSLLADVPATRFYQMEGADGPSYCDTPLSSFRGTKETLPYYMRIE